ncbi:MAG: glycoside hydrolase family 55 protein [Planctomycetes bacterium]|nr:glycoside hydrolase family 55 protein [Planctomycetota bacterium]
MQRAVGRGLGAVCLLGFACTVSAAPVRLPAIRSVSQVEARGKEVIARYADHQLAELGFLEVTKAPYNADPTGKSDATQALQQAIDDARDAQLVAYLPAGRYLVSDTIEGIIGVVRWDRWPYEGWADPWEAEASFEYPCVLMGVREGGRATLVLADRAPGFGDPNRPKPVLYFWARSMQVPGRPVADPNVPQANINFNQKILSLDLELGRGNPGAIGIDHRGAEGASVEDVRIEAQGAFAGFRYAPGSGGALHGLTVRGGRFGLYLTGSQPSPLVSDLELVGQTEAAVLASTRGPLTLVGARIQGAGIRGQKPWIAWDGALNVVDSVLDRPGSEPAILMQRSVVLSNVWVRTAGTVVQVDDHARLPGRAEGWTHVRSYAAGGRVQYPKELGGKIRRDTLWTERTERAEPLVQVTHSEQGPPAALAQLHRLPRCPDPFGPGVVNVKAPPWNAKGDGQTDDIDALQAAVDRHETVFLPKGKYRVSRPLRLKGGTRLFGVSNLYTCLCPVDKAAAYANPTEPQPLIETVDDPQARTLLALLRLEVPVLNPCVFALRWRAGRDSVVQNVYPSRPPWHPNAPAMNHPMIRIEGAGGGRWYTQTYLGGWSQGPDFRNLLVTGTREPLRFYHLQPQFARGNAMIEMRDVRNVDIYSMKAEGDFTLLWLRGCRDVRLFGFNGMLLPAPGWALIRVEDSRSLLLANIQPMMPRIGAYTGHLVNYDPRTSFLVIDDGFKIAGTEQFAWYQTDGSAPSATLKMR